MVYSAKKSKTGSPRERPGLILISAGHLHGTLLELLEFHLPPSAVGPDGNTGDGGTDDGSQEEHTGSESSSLWGGDNVKDLVLDGDAWIDGWQAEYAFQRGLWNEIDEFVVVGDRGYVAIRTVLGCVQEDPDWLFGDVGGTESPFTDGEVVGESDDVGNIRVQESSINEGTIGDVGIVGDPGIAGYTANGIDTSVGDIVSVSEQDQVFCGSSSKLSVCFCQWCLYAGGLVDDKPLQLPVEINDRVRETIGGVHFVSSKSSVVIVILPQIQSLLFFHQIRFDIHQKGLWETRKGGDIRGNKCECKSKQKAEELHP